MRFPRARLASPILAMFKTLSRVKVLRRYRLILREWVHALTERSAGSVGVPALRCFILPLPVSSFNFVSV